MKIGKNIEILNLSKHIMLKVILRIRNNKKDKSKTTIRKYNTILEKNKIKKLIQKLEKIK